MFHNLNDAIAKCNHLALTVLDTLQPWVQRNSYTRDVDGVNAMADLLSADFALPSLKLERHAGQEVGDHLVFTTDAWESSEPEKRIILVGHHDTVFPPGSFEEWKLEGDRLQGPGVLDMKGGLVTIHLALSALDSLDLLSALPLAFVCVGDEEIGSPDSTRILREVAKDAGCALVFEAGRVDDVIITRRKGTGSVCVSVEGLAAHAGNGHKEGINAICALSKFVVEAQKLTDYDKGVTVNVGLIKGGEARNTVPHHADCQVDFRLVNAEDGNELIEKLHTLAQKIAVDTHTQFEVTGGIARLPLERTESSILLFEAYSKAAKESGLGYQEAPLLGGGSDANTTGALGVPSIDGLGPRGLGFHTHQEYIEVSSLALRAESLVRFLLSWKQ